MKKVNIFEREVSVYDGVRDKGIGYTATLFDVLKDHDCKDLIDEYRKTKKKEAKQSLPAFTCSGVFSTKTNDGLIKHNGVICIDIDYKDNTDVINFDEIPNLMKYIPYVAYCGHSCGGEGYFVLMPIKDPKKHLQHYESACNDFERCGITVDRSCKNVSRTRFISYDDDAYFNYEAVEYSRMKEEVASNARVKEVAKKEKAKEIVHNTKIEVVTSNTKANGFDRSRFKAGTFPNDSILKQIEYDEIKLKVELIIIVINNNQIDITATYDDWYRVGAALANQFGEDGREYFHQVSRFYLKYNKRECDYKFDSCKKLRDIKIGTFFEIAKKYDVYV